MMGFGFGWIMMAVFWVAAVALGVWLLSLLFPRAAHNANADGTPPRAGTPGGTLESPAEILRQRYARGEITKEQYEQMHRDVEA